MEVMLSRKFSPFAYAKHDFYSSSHFFLKRVHQSCHPSYQQPHWALMSDIQTFKLKSCFRRELLNSNEPGILKKKTLACMHTSLRIWPSHLDPQSRVWFCLCKWASRGGGQPPTAPTLWGHH